MKRVLVVFGVIGLVLVAGAGAGYLWLSRPVEPRAFEEPGPSFESRQQASVVDTILAEYGVTQTAFSADDDGAYVGYNAPAEADWDQLQFAAMLALAQAAPEAGAGMAVLHEADAPKLAWTGDLDALRAAGDDEAAILAWLETVERTTF